MKHILFDMDGSLLPMDLNVFAAKYIETISKTMAQYGYSPKEFAAAIWKGNVAMVENDGAETNENRFWNCFARELGNRVYADANRLNAYYDNGFDEALAVCGFDEKAGKTLKALKDMGYSLTLASNPIFPKAAQLKRAVRAGVDPDVFDFVTSYENMNYCKPNINYYRQILSYLGCRAEDCLMVGNDVNEDMVASELGIKVFLLPACVINKYNKDISIYPQGDFDDLLAFVKTNF